MNIKTKEWLNDAISDFSKEISLIDIAFVREINEIRYLILVFNNLPESYEEVINNKFVDYLRKHYTKRNIDEDWEFNLRIFDKSVFLYNISKFDPEVIQYFITDVHLFLGEEHYFSIKNQFFTQNINPESDSIILPYFEDVLLSWNDAHYKYISLDIQLYRCFFNALKLIYSLTEDQQNLNLTNISLLTDYNKLKEVFNSLDFITDKPEIGFTRKKLYAIFFEEGSINLIEKQILIEEFLAQLLEWLFKWIESHYNKEKNKLFSLLYLKLKSFIVDSNFKDRFKINIMRIENNFSEILK